MKSKSQIKEKNEIIIPACDIISDGPSTGKWISAWNSSKWKNAVPCEARTTFQKWSLIGQKNGLKKFSNCRIIKKLDETYYLTDLGNDLKNGLSMLTIEEAKLTLKEANARFFAIETENYTPVEGNIIDKESYYIRVRDTNRYITIDYKDGLLMTTEDPGNAVPWKFKSTSNDLCHKIVTRQNKKRDVAKIQHKKEEKSSKRRKKS